MIRWHRQLSGHESEQTPGDSEGQASPVCCSPRGGKESDTTEQYSPLVIDSVLRGIAHSPPLMLFRMFPVLHSAIHAALTPLTSMSSFL